MFLPIVFCCGFVTIIEMVREKKLMSSKKRALQVRFFNATYKNVTTNQEEEMANKKDEGLESQNILEQSLADNIKRVIELENEVATLRDKNASMQKRLNDIDWGNEKAAEKEEAVEVASYKHLYLGLKEGVTLMQKPESTWDIEARQKGNY